MRSNTWPRPGAGTGASASLSAVRAASSTMARMRFGDDIAPIPAPVIIRSMNPRALLLVPLSAFAFGCGSRGGGGPAAPAQPTDPVAISPAAGAVVDSLTPTLVVKNAKGFDAGQATYDFVVLRPDDDGVVEEVAGVPAGAGQTSATPPQPLVRGGGYRWKAVAHGSSGTAESSPVAFEIGVTCEPGTDPWAKRVVDFFVTQCTRRTNIASLLDPTNVLGPP